MEYWQKPGELSWTKTSHGVLKKEGVGMGWEDDFPFQTEEICKSQSIFVGPVDSKKNMLPDGVAEHRHWHRTSSRSFSVEVTPKLTTPPEN